MLGKYTIPLFDVFTVPFDNPLDTRFAKILSATVAVNAQNVAFKYNTLAGIVGKDVSDPQ